MRNKLTGAVYWVQDENVLGYTMPEHEGSPRMMGVLHGSVLRGYKGCQYGPILFDEARARLATLDDFESFRCSSYGVSED